MSGAWGRNERENVQIKKKTHRFFLLFFCNLVACEKRRKKNILTFSVPFLLLLKQKNARDVAEIFSAVGHAAGERGSCIGDEGGRRE